MDLFKDIWSGFSKADTADTDTTPSSKLQDLVSKKKSKDNKASRHVSIFVVDNSAEAKTDLRSFQPATALKDDQKIRNQPPVAPGIQVTSSVSYDVASFLDTKELSVEEGNESSDDDNETNTLSTQSKIRVLQRTLTSKKFVKDAPTDIIKIHDEKGALTDEFKKVLHRLAQKRLKEELGEFDGKSCLNDVCYILLKGALEYLDNVKDDELQVDGVTSMIPEEYQVTAQRADFGRTESQILQFEIQRMRGSLRLGTEQTARKETKDARATSEQENMLRKQVEIGFLLNDPAVTLTIARFIEEDRTMRQFRALGLRQRAKETGRVLLNKVFSQEYGQAAESQSISEEKWSGSTISDIVLDF